MGPLPKPEGKAVTSTVKTAPPNSLLFVSDVDGGRPPLPVLGAQILATNSCISICCYPWVDGETTITLGPSAEVDPGTAAAFDGNLQTPSRIVVISTVDHKIILSKAVPDKTTRIRAWVNRPMMPNRIIIGFE